VYDAAAQILSVSNLQETNEVISRFAYTYDAAGNRTSETREDGTLRVWAYDPTSQLISEQRTEGESWNTLTADQWSDMETFTWGLLPAGSGAGPITTFQYDPVGNRLVLDADGELTTSTYDAANRLITSEDASGITTYTFDANGNQCVVETPAGEITTYSWSFEDQLIQIEEPDDVVTTQAYAPVTRNADELRFTKETENGITQFIWDNQNIIREVDEINTIEAEYTLNPQPYGDLVSQRREDESTFYNFDALGSTQSLTDETGTVGNEYAYGAFGKILEQTGGTENPFTWVGELGYYQEADGRYLLRRREYEQAIARFLSEDPIGFDGGDENLYPYVANAPVNKVDPSGLEETCSLQSILPSTGNPRCPDQIPGAGQFFKVKGPQFLYVDLRTGHTSSGNNPTWGTSGAQASDMLQNVNDLLSNITDETQRGMLLQFKEYLEYLVANNINFRFLHANQETSSIRGMAGQEEKDFLFECSLDKLQSGLDMTNPANAQAVDYARAVHYGDRCAQLSIAADVSLNLLLSAGGPKFFAQRPQVPKANTRPNLTVMVRPQGASSIKPLTPCTSDLLTLGSAAGKGNLTKAGHSLSKHAAGIRSGSNAFANPKGNPTQINEQAQKLLGDILNDPAKTVKQRPGRPGEQLLQISRSDGSGVIYKWDGSNWVFSHFAENLF